MPVSFAAKDQDLYIDNIIRNMPDDVKETLTQEQADALLGSLSKAYIGARHMIDKRGTINLFFARYYVVFLMGQDQRAATRNFLVKRRKKVAVAVSFSIYALVMAFVAMNFIGFVGIAVLATLYFIKSGLGINIFEDSHLIDFLQ